MNRNALDEGHNQILIVASDRSDELGHLASEYGFDPVAVDQIPSAQDVSVAGSILVDAERFDDLPLADLAQHDVRLWVTNGTDPWRAPLPRWGSIAKRTIDVVGAAAFLLVTSPALAAIAIAIKVGSDGPVFHAQDRLGADGRWFRMHKFRTMAMNNDASQHLEYFEQFAQGEVEQTDGLYKMVNDPRVTRIGQLLRKYSIDEVPQFLDVLRGDMSIVGPRPMLPREITTLSGSAWRRLRVKPGITGLWQVSGRSKTTFETMIELDLAYVHNWTLRQELQILLRTPGALLRAETA